MPELRKDRCVFCDLVQQELAEREGVVEETLSSWLR